MRRLLVAEKFSAAVRLASVLSEGKAKRLRADGVSQFTFSRDADEWRVFPLRGHFVNLDYPAALNDWDGTDLGALADAEPVPEVTDPALVEALRQASAGIEEVVVATDFDREGELIGLEAVRVVRQVSPGTRVRRARFSSLTRRELLEAFSNLVDLDERLASSAATREVVDLAWGAVLTRFLSLACGRRGKDVLSVGRVQTPTLALLVEREREVEEFVPTPWWRVLATFGKDGSEFLAEHAQSPFSRRDEAEAACGLAGLATEGWIESMETTVQEERPPVPLNTTLFIGLANRAGLSAARAMAIAESLYRDGLISYPRTDNTVYPRTLALRPLLEELRSSDLAGEVEKVLALPEIRPTRGRTESTDHPPIYPTGAARRGKLKPDLWRVYELVVRRFLATLSPPARYDLTVVQVSLGDVWFTASGRRLVEEGWRAIAPAADLVVSLPDLGRGGAVEVRGVSVQEGRTRAPARYVQGTLVQEMEDRGLGTKSTRHEIVQKLYDRGYVSGRSVRPTEGGRAVAEALEVHASAVTRSETTAALESELESIADGSATPETVVADSRARLKGVLAELELHRDGIARWVRESLAWERDHGPCEKCGTGRMVLRKSRAGSRFLGCTGYPACRNSRPVPREEFVVRARAAETSLAG